MSMKETGLATLASEGLDLSGEDETLQWKPATSLPDADLRVLIWFQPADTTEPTVQDWDSGWWDGEAWRLCESGGLVDGAVLFWAEPEGPKPNALKLGGVAP